MTSADRRERHDLDPHKLSATIEVVDHQETVLTSGRFGTDKAGYAAMRKHVAAWPNRTWAVEGSNGAGRPFGAASAGRRRAGGRRAGQARGPARLLDTGHGRKTDAHDAHSVAVAAVRGKELRVLALDPELEALRMLVDRREELARQRTQTANRLQRLFAELTPGRAKRTSPPGRRRRSWPRCIRETWLGRPAVASLQTSWPSWLRSRSASSR